MVRLVLALASGALLCATAVCAWMTVQPFVGSGPALTAVLGSLMLVSASLGAALAGVWQRTRVRMPWAGVAWGGVGAWLLAAQSAHWRVLALLEPQGLLPAVAVAFVVFFLPPLVLLTALLLTAPQHDGRMAAAAPGWLTVSGLAAAVSFGLAIQWGLATLGVARWLTITSCAALVCAALVLLRAFVTQRSRVTILVVLLLLGAASGITPVPGPHARGLRVLHHTGTQELRVLDHDGYRYLLIDGEPAVGIDPATGDAVAADASTLELMLQFFWPPGRALLLGMPDPQFVRALTRRGWDVDVAAPRPALTLLQEYLGLDAAWTTSIPPSQIRRGLLDASRPVMQQRYHIIVVQLRGAADMSAYATRTGIAVLRHLLREDGILLMRLEAPGWSHPWPRAVSAALLEDFREVWCLPVTGGPRHAGSLVLAASDRYLEIRQHHLPTPQDHPHDPEAQLQSGRARNAWRYRFVPDVEGAQILELATNPAPSWLDAFQRIDRRRLHQRIGGHDFTW